MCNKTTPAVAATGLPIQMEFQCIEVIAPNQLWALDITPIRLMKEFVFLSAIIDVYTLAYAG
jgi:transposase InsO family protein